MIAIAVLSGFVLAVFAPFVHRLTKPLSGWVLAALPAAIFFYFVQMMPQIAHGETVRAAWDWVPSFGVTLSFYVDGLSLIFALLISGIGAFIVAYAGGYLKGHKDHGRFMGFILAFMGSMLGLVLADNLITLFVFWELTSITSFLLIGFNHDKPRSRRAAIQALVVTGGGGLALLGGLLLLGVAGGSFELSELLASGSIAENPYYLPIFLLVLAGAFTKSAQVPFHFWLPNAMEAPTPVSAYLHSATMVKAGVYLLARMNPILGGTDIWELVLPVFGGITLLTGTLLGLRQTDVKQILAYTTVASLGLLVMLIGIGTDVAITAAVLYLISHALFKGGLFMVAGSIDHSTGTRETVRLSGLGKVMPLTALAGLLAGLSMMGIWPFFGFIAKEVIYEATLHHDPRMWITAVAIIGNSLMLAAAALVGLRPFFGKLLQTPKEPHEGSPSLWLGALTLGVLGVVFGMMSHFSGEYLVAPMASAIGGRDIHTALHLWPEVSLPLALSGVTIFLGFIWFWQIDHLRSLLYAATQRLWGPDHGSDQFLAALVRVSKNLTGLLQTGRLNFYITFTLTMLALTLGIPVIAYGLLPTSIVLPDVALHIYGVFGLTVVGALALLFARSRLQAILSMGVTGFSVALIFLIFGAPDLAFTQFMVETLSVVIIALVLLRLPVDTYDRRDFLPSLRDAGLAISIGVAFTSIMMAIGAEPLDLTLTEYFAANSYLEAHGRNIVNVILVDFRALDTLGEIAVVLVAGLAALALIKVRDGILTSPDANRVTREDEA